MAPSSRKGNIARFTQRPGPSDTQQMADLGIMEKINTWSTTALDSPRLPTLQTSTLWMVMSRVPYIKLLLISSGRRFNLSVRHISATTLLRLLPQRYPMIWLNTQPQLSPQHVLCRLLLRLLALL